MAYRQVNPAELEGEDLRNWYLRSPDEIEDARALREQAERDEFFGGGRWQEARYERPPAPRPVPVRPAPETQAGYAPDAPPSYGPPASFFGSHVPLPYSNDYLPGLPSPLNRVEQTRPMPNMYQLGDGTIVSAEEVDRIYAEQQRRMAGADDPQPEGYVRASDRLKDGYIPAAAQMAKGQRELDATCHPNGGWELDPGFYKRSERARRYEAQITRAEGLDYVVRNPGERPVKFDGCAVWDPRRQLLEAKGPGYDAVIEAGQKYRFIRSVETGVSSQGERQVTAARGRPVDWNAAERGAMEFFKDVIPKRDSIRFVHTPAR